MATAFKQVANRATGNLNANIGAGDTSIVLQAGQGANFLTPNANGYLVSVDNERILVTAKSVDTLTVTRGQDGTSAAAHSAGAALELRPLAKHFDDVTTLLNGIENATSDLNGSLYLEVTPPATPATGRTGSRPSRTSPTRRRSAPA